MIVNDETRQIRLFAEPHLPSVNVNLRSLGESVAGDTSI